MTLRFSTALRNQILASQGLKQAMSNCVLKVYTGSQPASADAAPTGTLLCTYSASSGSLTREVLAVGSLTLSGTSGSANTFTLNSIEIMGAAVSSDGTVAGTATLVAAQINNNPANVYVTASTTGATGVITLTAKPGMGALVNTWVPAGTGTTISFGSASNMTGGVYAVNGLRWGVSSGGVLAKQVGQVWSGVASATGTAGWFRIEAAVSDAGALDTTASVLRIDGAVATSGAELNLSSTAIQNTVSQTIDTFTITEPTA
jgi:hypothetical protein